jgi:predicted dehydrogenase
MQPSRIGMIGAGAVATRHADTLLGFGDVQLVAVADPAAGRARRLAERTGAAAYDNWLPMLERERLDAVYVCVPPFAHGAPELAAIEAGLPFFVEKPLAIDLETAESIAARLDGTGLVTCAGYHWRWLDTFELAQELLAGNPARLALGYWLDKVPPPPWWVRRDGSGGQTIEQTTHVLDLARALVGEVTEVHAAGGRVDPAALPGTDVDEVTTATLRFATGAVGTVTSTCLLKRLHRAGLHLYTQGLALELSESELVVDDGGGNRAVHPAGGDARPRPDRDFVDAVRGGPDRIRVPYPEALRTHRLACAITRSADEGRTVALPDEYAHA